MTFPLCVELCLTRKDPSMLNSLFMRRPSALTLDMEPKYQLQLQFEGLAVLLSSTQNKVRRILATLDSLSAWHLTRTDAWTLDNKQSYSSESSVPLCPMKLAKTSPFSFVLVFFMNMIECSGSMLAVFSTADLAVRSSFPGSFGFSSSFTCGEREGSGS